MFRKIATLTLRFTIPGNRIVKVFPITFTDGSAEIELDGISTETEKKVCLFIWDKTNLAPLCSSVSAVVDKNE